MRFAFLILLLALCAAAAAQSPSQKLIIWTGDENCGLASKEEAPADMPICSSSATPRGTVSTITNGKIRLSVAFLEDDGYLILAAQIENNSDVLIDIDTDRWGAAHFRSADDLIWGAKPIAAETSIPSRDIVRGIKSGVRMDNSSDTFMASIVRSAEVKELKRSDGSRVKQTVLVDDMDAQRDAGSRNAARTDRANAEQERIRQNAITQKWIAAGSKIKGLVYFRRIKKAGFVVYSLGIADTTYIFRLPRPKRQK